MTEQSEDNEKEQDDDDDDERGEEERQRLVSINVGSRYFRYVGVGVESESVCVSTFGHDEERGKKTNRMRKE